MLGPCLSHIRAIHEMAQIFTGESCMQNRIIPFSDKLLGLYKGHVWDIIGAFFGISLFGLQDSPVKI